MTAEPVDNVLDIIEARPETSALIAKSYEEGCHRRDFLTIRVTNADWPLLIAATLNLGQSPAPVGPPTPNEVGGDFIQNAKGSLTGACHKDQVASRASVRLAPDVKSDLIFVEGLGASDVLSIPSQTFGAFKRASSQFEPYWKTTGIALSLGPGLIHWELNKPRPAISSRRCA